MGPGFTSTTCDFFAALERQNDRQWWASHRAPYDEVIKPGFTALVASIDGFGPWRVYQPHNDTRFRPDAAPYKTFIGAVSERPDGIGAFVQIGASGLRIGTGMPIPAPDQLARLRAAIADERGPALVAAIGAVEQAGGRVVAGRWPALRRVPNGYPAEHPFGELLRWKGVEIDHRLGRPAWLDTAEAGNAISARIRLGEHVHDWLATAVGPSELSAEERFAPKRRPSSGTSPRSR